MGWNVVHWAEIVDGDVHGVNDSFDESRTESVFGCSVEGDVLSAIAEGVLDVGVGSFSQEQTVSECEWQIL